MNVVFNFIETSLFTKGVGKYLSDESFAALQTYLSERPDAGDVIRGSGGVRKLRWAAQGRGKRGGVRVIYYLQLPKERIWLLTLYPKNVQDGVAPQLLKQIKEAIENE